MDRIAAKGRWGRVEWAIDSNQSLAAKADFENLGDGDAAKAGALFQRLAEFGFVSNREKFKSLGKTGADLFEFKSFQDRFIGDFRPGRRFLIAGYAKKKKDKLDQIVVKRAVEVLRANDKWEKTIGIDDMKRPSTDVERFEESSAGRRRLLREEELILDVTELLSGALEDKRMTKSELAEKLGKTKGFVTQVLSGNRNLTLRTIADIADALDCRLRLIKQPAQAPTKKITGVRSRATRVRTTGRERRSLARKYR